MYISRDHSTTNAITHSWNEPTSSITYRCFSTEAARRAQKEKRMEDKTFVGQVLGFSEDPVWSGWKADERTCSGRLDWLQKFLKDGPCDFQKILVTVGPRIEKQDTFWCLFANGLGLYMAQPDNYGGFTEAYRQLQVSTQIKFIRYHREQKSNHFKLASMRHSQ